jgi:hypothetical protein
VLIDRRLLAAADSDAAPATAAAHGLTAAAAVVRDAADVEGVEGVEVDAPAPARVDNARVDADAADPRLGSAANFSAPPTLTPRLWH